MFHDINTTYSSWFQLLSCENYLCYLEGDRNTRVQGVSVYCSVGSEELGRSAFASTKEALLCSRAADLPIRISFVGSNKQPPRASLFRLTRCLFKHVWVLNKVLVKSDERIEK